MILDIEMLIGYPTSVRIQKTTKESNRAATLFFDMPRADVNVVPGQFLMVWIPGVDEIPMSMSFWKPPTAGVTVQAIGEATNALFKYTKGQWIGIRGPFGTGFSYNSKKALVVGGGIGMAPLRPLVSELLTHGTEITLLIGAKTKNELIQYEFKERKEKQLKVELATDDGSKGFKGLATELAQEMIETSDFDTIYTCGPELMMKGLYDLSSKRGIMMEASLERFMKCGCGICGSCAMDPDGKLACVEGPVFKSSDLETIIEFGEYRREATGIKKQC
jgi:dihydroorotate dehydrogenase electron transfer subunit